MWCARPQFVFPHRHRRLRREHGLTGDWTLVNKDDSKTDLNWTTAYSGGVQSGSGTGSLKGKSSEVSTRGASGSYASGATSGSYSEDWKSNRSGAADINLTREKNGSWTGNGTSSGSSSGNTDWSDKTKLVTVAALYDGTLTTTTETDAGKHYEYDMSTSRNLRNNTWSAYEGSGTGKGKGWDYLTVTKDGSYSFSSAAGDRFSLEVRDYIDPNSFMYSVTTKIDGSLSDKLDYKYDDTFNLTSSGWTTSTIGNGTRKITDDYSFESKGSAQQSGVRPRAALSNGYSVAGDLSYDISASLNIEQNRHTKTDIVFDWTNDSTSITEQTKTSNKFAISHQGSVDALFLTVEGNIGSGNGSVKASNYHEEYSGKSTQTLKIDASRTVTSWKGGTAFYESYKATDESKSQWSTETTGHWSSNSRVNTIDNGVYTVSKFDGGGDSESLTESNTVEKSVTTWQWSFDGQSYGTNVSTLFESSDTTSTTSDSVDSQSAYTTKIWNSSGIIFQDSGGSSYHPRSDTNFSQLTEITSTNTGFQPQFLMGGVMAVMTITPVTGWNPSTATTFSFSTPSMSVLGASNAASLVLPPLVMTTTSFAAMGVAADTRSYWQLLKDSLSQVGDVFIDAALQTAVWISDQLDSLGSSALSLWNDAKDALGQAWDSTKEFAKGYYHFLTNPSEMDLDLRIIRNFTLGVVVGAVVAAGVIVAAPFVIGAATTGLIFIGVPAGLASATVSTLVTVGGVVGIVGTIKGGIQDYKDGNYESLAFTGGALLGGALAGFSAQGRGLLPKSGGNCFIGCTRIVIGTNGLIPSKAIHPPADVADNSLWAVVCILVGLLSGVAVLNDEKRRGRHKKFFNRVPLRPEPDDLDRLFENREAVTLLNMAQAEEEASALRSPVSGTTSIPKRAAGRQSSDERLLFATVEPPPSASDQPEATQPQTDSSDSTTESTARSKQPLRSLLAIGSVISLLFGLWLWSGGKSLDQTITPTVSAISVATTTATTLPQYETIAIQDVAVGQRVTMSVPGGSELPDTRLDSDPPKESLSERTSSDLTTYEYPADELVAAAIRIDVQDGTIVSAESDDETIDAATLIGTRYVVGDTDGTDVTRLLCRTVDLEMSKPDGSIADLSVIRPLWWMADTGAKLGRTFDLGLHEIGLSGEARVLSIRPCDVDSRDTSPGMNIVIGKIRHRNAVVWDLTFDGNSTETLGVTANHPLYSQARHAWVPAGELQLHEVVQTLNGEATLTARSQRPNRETVFNMEVHRTHAYHVSGLGVLAHNLSILCDPKKLPHHYQHAEDFGVHGNWNTANGKAFQGALNAHVNAANTQPIVGTYRGNIPVTHYFDPATNLNVMLGPNNNLVGSWKLGASQVADLLANGNVK